MILTTIKIIAVIAIAEIVLLLAANGTPAYNRIPHKLIGRPMLYLRCGGKNDYSACFKNNGCLSRWSGSGVRDSLEGLS